MSVYKEATPLPPSLLWGSYSQATWESPASAPFMYAGKDASGSNTFISPKIIPSKVTSTETSSHLRSIFEDSSASTVDLVDAEKAFIVDDEKIVIETLNLMQANLAAPPVQSGVPGTPSKPTILPHTFNPSKFGGIRWPLSKKGAKWIEFQEYSDGDGTESLPLDDRLESAPDPSR
ncbi:MAG: hypothetical protein MMC33_003662 [Icmadophila ericetorum]|nr:hypothetical protein [Icmadophila ericetorum]